MLSPFLPTIKKTGTELPLKPYDVECICAVHEILTKDLGSRITVESLALEIGINRNKLHYGFRQVFGVTINDFLEQQRMEKAEELLENTHKSIKVIAALTGYKSSSSFGDVFKKRHGISPLQYRKRSWTGVSEAV
jgi:AraC-like DNA-binding protein